MELSFFLVLEKSLFFWIQCRDNRKIKIIFTALVPVQKVIQKIMFKVDLKGKILDLQKMVLKNISKSVQNLAQSDF